MCCMCVYLLDCVYNTEARSIGFTGAGVARGYELLMWVLGPESGSSAGVATVPNH